MIKYLSYDGLKHLWDSRLEPSLFPVVEYETSESEANALDEKGETVVSIDASSLKGGVKGVMLTLGGESAFLKADAYRSDGSLMRATASIGSGAEYPSVLALEVSESGTSTLSVANPPSGADSTFAPSSAPSQIQSAVVTSIDDLATKMWLGRKIIAMEYISDGSVDKSRCGCVWELVYDKEYGTYSASVWRVTAIGNVPEAVEFLDPNHYLNVAYMAEE